MTTSLETRVKRLEAAMGDGGECPRCSGTTVIYVNRKLGGVSKPGRKFTLEEARAFVDEEEDGRCPLCGAEREPTIRLSSWPPEMG